jgi:hypothetical protein
MTWDYLSQDDLTTRKWAREAKQLSLEDWFIQDIQYSSRMAKTNATIWSLRTLIDSSGTCNVKRRGYHRTLNYNAPGGIRTHGLQIRSQLLYPLSYGRKVL